MLLVRSLLLHLTRLMLYGSLGVLLTLLAVFVMYLEGRPDLEVWHLADLDEEFTADSPVTAFGEYLELEDRLFEQLNDKVYARTGPPGSDQINRYKRGSLADPARWPRNWNRSYVMEADEPSARVLLLHGLSDAPYSLRAMAQRLHAAGATVLGLRIPGHGTAPSGLVEVRWQDMAAAVRLALRHLSAHDNLPVYIVGYSNGAALAIDYALASLEEEDHPTVAGLVLLSPEIGVTRTAALAVWQARLGHLLGLEKLAWNNILLEYEPFKYGSFAVNAGDVSYRITHEIRRKLDRLSAGDRLQDMPPVLAFSSLIDATVVAPALVANLFNRLPANDHELVLFDINRQAGIEHILRWQPDAMIDALRQAPGNTYRFSLVTNENEHTPKVVVRHWQPGKAEASVEALGLEWPGDVYSLSHVALPFPPDDPVYGANPTASGPGIHLGDMALRGERGALLISDSAMLRLRWNPFYTYLEDRALAFMGLGPGRTRGGRAGTGGL
ncbi:MAG: alpha/beta hydrolase [Halioglobus sp.]|jgi:alpha-beta hydrolase superfamily lysophospholipase